MVLAPEATRSNEEQNMPQDGYDLERLVAGEHVHYLLHTVQSERLEFNVSHSTFT
jgi:hypothetical protein